jgi:hypothetical protein
MATNFNNMAESERWRLMVSAATKAAGYVGYKLSKIPGRGRSNTWAAEIEGKKYRAAIRTSQDRWLAFPPLKNGAAWKTLDDVDMLIIATVNDTDDPTVVEVYTATADEARKRFDAAYQARTSAGLVVKERYGMWINLDRDDRDTPAAVGAGLVEGRKPIGVYPIADLIAAGTSGEIALSDADPEEVEEPQPQTIASVMAWARNRVAEIAGVQPEAVSLELKVNY